MNDCHTYCVGGHLFAVKLQKGILSEKELKPYVPFQTHCCSEGSDIFTLTILSEINSLSHIGNKITELQDENGCISLFSLPNGDISIHLSTNSGDECCRLHISQDYRIAKAWINTTYRERCYALDTALMMLYTFASSKYNTLMVHASTVEYDGNGYLFLGKSGTGKSTHSRLWTEHINGSTLLNDDNPIVRIIDGTVYVYGSPWSGKTCCYRNRRIPVGGIVRLQQAPYNKITPLTGIKAYASLLPSCSCMKWNHEMANAIHSTISEIIEKIPIYSLECLPNQDAAKLCFAELRSNHKV